MPHNIYELLWIFIIYAFLGWCMEVGYAALKLKQFSNRGFMNGPVCPIYGFGVLIIIVCLTPLKDNIILLFVGSVILTSLLEYLAGWIMEKLFGTRWWDYSDMAFNIGGYICLQFSLLWGIGCMFVMKIIHPVIFKIIELIPISISRFLLFILAVYFISDMIMTVITLLKFNKKLKFLDKTAKRMRVLSDEIGENIYENVMYTIVKTESFQQEHKDLLNKINDKADYIKDDIRDYISDTKEEFKDKIDEFDELKKQFIANINTKEKSFNRIVKAFPSMKNKNSNEVLQIYKRHIHKKNKK